MNDFSHDELQQVIRKYDGEYKRLKKQAVDSAQKLSDLEERALKAERECKEMFDQALCYKENDERLKEHV